MTISSYWDGVEQFSAGEAAYLMLGLEPETNKVETGAAHSRLLQRMNAGFLDACGHFRFCLENAHDWDELSISFWAGDDEFVLLPSVELVELAIQCAEARTDSELCAYGELAMRWLDTAIDSFSAQRFGREMLANWAYWSRIQTTYEFKSIAPLDPTQWRLRVAAVLEECGGNKSEAARRLGISRTRVDQLLAGNRPSKGLRKEPTGPFSGLVPPEEEA